MAERPPDRIHIRDLRLRCIVGTGPEERRETQQVVINIALEVDLRAAGRSDRLEETVDYAAVEQAVIAAVEASEFLLIERLAERVAEICLTYRGALAVRVRVEKPAAPRRARTVEVEITRRRSSER